jgi:invasion protein IalB
MMTHRALGLIFALALVPPGLSAQDAAPTPERIVEAFGAWEMRCQRIDPADSTSPLACEVTQETLIEGAAQPVTRIAIGRPAPDAGLTAVVQLPLGLWLPSGAGIDLGTAGGSHALQVLRCVPQGCIAELPLTDAMIAALSDDAAPQSALSFEMQPGSPARVPLVHTGFADALAALQARVPPAP